MVFLGSRCLSHGRDAKDAKDLRDVKDAKTGQHHHHHHGTTAERGRADPTRQPGFRRNSTMKGTGTSAAGKSDSRAGQLAKRSESPRGDHHNHHHHRHQHDTPHPPPPAPHTPGGARPKGGAPSPGAGLTYNSEFLQHFKCHAAAASAPHPPHASAAATATAAAVPPAPAAPLQDATNAGCSPCTPLVSTARSRSRPSRENAASGGIAFCTPVHDKPSPGITSSSAKPAKRTKSTGRAKQQCAATPLSTPDALRRRDAIQQPLPIQPLQYSPCRGDSGDEGDANLHTGLSSEGQITPVRFSSLCGGVAKPTHASASPTPGNRRMKSSPLTSLLARKSGIAALLGGGGGGGAAAAAAGGASTPGSRSKHTPPSASLKPGAATSGDWSLTKGGGGVAGAAQQQQQASFDNLEESGSGGAGGGGNFNVDTMLREMLGDGGSAAAGGGKRAGSGGGRRQDRAVFCTPATTSGGGEAHHAPATPPSSAACPSQQAGSRRADRGRAGFERPQKPAAHHHSGSSSGSHHHHHHHQQPQQQQQQPPINPIVPLLPPACKSVNLNSDLKRSAGGAAAAPAPAAAAAAAPAPATPPLQTLKRCPTAPPPGAAKMRTRTYDERRAAHEPPVEDAPPALLAKKALSFSSLARAHSLRPQGGGGGGGSGGGGASTPPAAGPRAVRPQPPASAPPAARLPPTPTSSRKKRLMCLLGSPGPASAEPSPMDKLLDLEGGTAAAAAAAAVGAPPKQGSRSALLGEPVQKAAPAAALVPPSVSNIDCLWSAPGSEDSNDYGVGGYFSTKKGQRIGPNGRYHVVSKLGWGGFSTVWLCWDEAGFKAMSGSLESSGSLPPHTGATDQFVAVKISKCGNSVLKSSREEVNILQYLAERLDTDTDGCGAVGKSRLVSLLDHFEQQGKFGTHICMVFPVMGQNLLTLVEQGHRHQQSVGNGVQKGMRTEDDRRFIRDTVRNMLVGMSVMEKLGVVHTDLKPENILLTTVSQRVRKTMRNFQSELATRQQVTLPPCLLVPTSATYADSAQAGPATLRLDNFSLPAASGVKVSDFGLAIPLDPEATGAPYNTRFAHAFEKFGVQQRGVATNANGVTMQTREYRAPEILYGHPFTCGTDVWSAGCIAYELITGTFLMDPKKPVKSQPGPKSEDQINIDHVSLMHQLIGSHAVRPDSGRHAPKYFNSDGSFKHRSRMQKLYPKRRLEDELLPFMGSRSEAAEAASFITFCLSSHDPKKRPTASRCLEHSWIAPDDAMRRL